MSTPVEGCLLIADIGGYTRYLAGVELEHSHDVITDLIQTVVGTLCGPFELAKLEGDAVFCYQAGDPAPADAVVGVIDAAYDAYHDRLRDIAFATTCSCNACLHIPSLSLKFVVHTGRFMLHEVAGLRELLGNDVIIVHRLLKNEVTTEHGLAGYALLSRACLDRHAIDPVTFEMLSHVEHFDDVGDIEGAVLNLEARRSIRERETVVRIGEAEGRVVGDFVAPLSPEEMWVWMTDPNKRPVWQDMTRVVRRAQGDLAVGNVNHCMHGDVMIVEQILDWKPPRYYTCRYEVPGVGPSTWTFELEPVEGGTRVRAFARLDGGADQAEVGEGFLEQIATGNRANAARLLEMLSDQA